MKEIRFYTITKEQAENTEYRPSDVEIDTIECGEDDWSYMDVIKNDAEYAIEIYADCGDLTVYRVTDFDFDPEELDAFEQFVVELK